MMRPHRRRIRFQSTHILVRFCVDSHQSSSPIRVSKHYLRFPDLREFEVQLLIYTDKVLAERRTHGFDVCGFGLC